MPIYFFPQWQGSFEENQLEAAAKALRTALVNNPAYAPLHFVDIPLQGDGSLDLAQGILARDAIVRQAQTARNILDREHPARIITLGGDCGIEVGPISLLNARHDGDLAILWIDAHPDVHTPQSSVSHTFHGMPLRTVMGEGDPALLQQVSRAASVSQVFLIGVRDFDPPERQFIEQQAIASIPKLTPQSVDEALIQGIRQRGFHNIYIHLDLDALEPQEFPYLDYPTPDGLSVASVAEALARLANSFRLVGMGITEYGSTEGKGLDTLEPILRFFVEQSRP